MVFEHPSRGGDKVRRAGREEEGKDGDLLYFCLAASVPIWCGGGREDGTKGERNIYLCPLSLAANLVFRFLYCLSLASFCLISPPASAICFPSQPSFNFPHFYLCSIPRFIVLSFSSIFLFFFLLAFPWL